MIIQGTFPHQFLLPAECTGLLAAGIAIGLALALLATRPLAIFFVPGLSPSHLAGFLAVIGIFLLTAGLAAIGPVRRALRVKPLDRLRRE